MHAPRSAGCARKRRTFRRVVCGWSFGANVALRETLDDERVSALVLIGLPLEPGDVELPAIPRGAAAAGAPRAGDAPVGRTRRVLPPRGAAGHGYRVPASAGRDPRGHRPLPVAEGARGRRTDRGVRRRRGARGSRLERAFALRVSVGPRIHRRRLGSRDPHERDEQEHAAQQGPPHQQAQHGEARRRRRPRATGSPTRGAAEVLGSRGGVTMSGSTRRAARRMAARSIRHRCRNSTTKPDREEREGDEREDDEQQVLAIHARQPSMRERLTPDRSGADRPARAWRARSSTIGGADSR